MTLSPTGAATVETADGATLASGIELEAHHHIPEPGEPLSVLDRVGDADVQVARQRRVVGVETSFVRDDSVGGADWRQELTFIVPEE